MSRTSGSPSSVVDQAGKAEIDTGSSKDVFQARPTAEHVAQMKAIVRRAIEINLATASRNLQRDLGRKITMGVISDEDRQAILDTAVAEFTKNANQFAAELSNLSALPRGTTGKYGVTFHDAALTLVPSDRRGSREKVGKWLLDPSNT